jgi:subtilisin family serine protease
MNEPINSSTFESNRKSYAFARRFLISATCIAAVVIFTSISAYGQGAANAARAASSRYANEEAVASGENLTSTAAGAPAAPAAIRAQAGGAALGIVKQPSTKVNHAVLRAPAARLSGHLPVTNAPKLNPSEILTVMVELADPPASAVYAESMKGSVARSGVSPSKMTPAALTAATTTAVSLSRAHVAKLEAAQTAVLPRVTALAHGGKILFRTKSAYNGISLHVRRDQIAALKALPGVKDVHVQTPKYRTAATSIDFLGGRTAWTNIGSNSPFGLHGEGIKVADIDTGLDYIHTNFGGPGTPAAYASISDTGPVPNAYFPSLKVPGGYDFAGNAYDANQPPGTGHDPVPDPNPLDSNGHGTGTASLIGGIGVNADGSTYVGTYDNATNLTGMRIAPGIAPKCFLYPLRVFGTSGSTNLVVQAIDWAIDPNGDGNLSDHMDVINMSLGSPLGYNDDPDCIAATNASAIGVIVCSAAGNNGDSYYNVSAPSVANNTLSVAATFNDQGGIFFDSSVSPTFPPALVGQNYPSLYGSPAVHVPPGGLSGQIVWSNPANANGTLINAADFAGRIVLIDRGVSTFLAKATAAQNNGAIGCIIVNNTAAPPIVMALSAAITIPTVMISQANGAAIKAQLDPTTRMGVSVTIKDDNGFIPLTSTAADTLPFAGTSGYTARGPRAGDVGLKPDLTAPAETVAVASALTGNLIESFNGTSSATPHVAGMMALLRQLHPTWTIEELMALAMNTANHNAFVGPSTGQGNQYGVGRMGAGRIDIAAAVNAHVIAYNQTDPGTVNMSFGVVEVPVDSPAAPPSSLFTRTKTLTLSNKGAVDVTYNLTYQDVTPVNGANFAVGTGSAVTVPAGSSVSVPVTFTATGSLLKHVREASVAATFATPFGALPREWQTEKTGYAVLTPTGGTEPTIRVALFAAPKPVSSMRATLSSVTPGADTGQFTLGLTGASINTGASQPVDILSLVKPFELQYASPLAGVTNPPVSPYLVKYVGITSDYLAGQTAGDTSQTVLTFGVDLFGNVSVPSISGSFFRVIYIDADADGSFDHQVYIDTIPNGTDPTNVYYTLALDISGSGFYELPANGFGPNALDTNVYNTSTMTFSVFASDVGLLGPGQSTRFNYAVQTFDRLTGDLVDDTGLLTYDMANPGLDVQDGGFEPSFYPDLSAVSIPVNYNGTNFAQNGSLGMMLTHMHNGTGERSEVVVFAKPTILSFSPASGPIGTRVQISGTNFGPGTKVTFFNNKPATNVTVINSNTILATVPAGTISGNIRVSNAAGSSTSRTRFTVTP